MTPGGTLKKIRMAPCRTSIPLPFPLLLVKSGASPFILPTDTAVIQLGGPGLDQWNVDELSVLTNMTVEGGLMVWASTVTDRSM